MGRYSLGTLCLILASLLSAGLASADTERLWADVYDGGASLMDDGIVAICDPSGNPVVGAESTESAVADLLIRKMSRLDGSQIWAARYAAPNGNDMSISEMTWDSAGQLLVAAFIRGCVG